MWHHTTAASCSTSRSCSHVVVVVAAVVVVAPLLRDTSITPDIRLSSERCGSCSRKQLDDSVTTQHNRKLFSSTIFYPNTIIGPTLFIRRNATNVADTTTTLVHNQHVLAVASITSGALIAFVAYFLASVTLNGNPALTSNTTRLPYSRRYEIRILCISFLLTKYASLNARSEACSIYKSCSKTLGVYAKKNWGGAQNMLNLARFRTPFYFERNYLRNKYRYVKSENFVHYSVSSHVQQKAR